ncbi:MULTISPECIES: hypothetical protein [Cellulosimicrobium]|uniref:hypothetical protein n=1 Tax=Cellulosimicrobium TaxID=157920 RepID=UPI001BAE2A23|nr:hypothetical protein [Cellulosimicrobium cellulans]QUC01991.1 hypothetical protein J5A69_19605 [Cellulosimicrobium cellulans]
MKPSKRWARDVDLLTEFRGAYIDLLNSAQARSDGLFMELVPAVDHGIWQAKRRAVAMAAGAAGAVHERHGGTYTLANGAYMTRDVNPVVNWEMSLRDPQQLRPDMVIASVEAAIGAANKAAADASEREKGLTGLIAGFLRWPANLREAVGPGRSVRTAAGAIGVLGQVLVGTAATALATGLVTGIATLWQMFF